LPGSGKSCEFLGGSMPFFGVTPKARVDFALDCFLAELAFVGRVLGGSFPESRARQQVALLEHIPNDHVCGGQRGEGDGIPDAVDAVVLESIGDDKMIGGILPDAPGQAIEIFGVAEFFEDAIAGVDVETIVTP
jgi:hypothetical protein